MRPDENRRRVFAIYSNIAYLTTLGVADIELRDVPMERLQIYRMQRSPEIASHFGEDATAGLDTGRPQLKGCRRRTELKMVRMHQI
jgi:hypothetical protein